ncbi:MAG: hypothetical protein C4539_18045 [Ignavibacteriales bacterium]|nr:MAG: hypothetical protein C4539_18045 [Ignavibacteriales bacterium]
MKLKFLFFLLLSINLFAEGGSGYTRIGIGDLVLSGSARRNALGGLGAALYERDNVSANNPAAWTGLAVTRFETGIKVNSVFTKDQNYSSFYSNSKFSGFNIGIPIQRDYGISFVAGINPYSDVRMKIINEDSKEGINYTQTFEGLGGLSKSFFGLSYILPFNISFGASFDYYNGDIEHQHYILFNNSSYSDSYFKTVYKYSGIGGTFGLITGDLTEYIELGPLRDLRFGAAFSLASTLNSDTTYSLTSSYSDNTLSAGKTETKIPFRLNLGLNFSYKRCSFVIDYLYQPWSEYKVSNRKDSQLQNQNKFAAGVEYRVPDDASNDFFERFIFRGGIGYEQTQFKAKGKSIDQLSLFGGFSFPIDQISSIDFSVEAGQRGTTDLNLLKENFLKFNFSINFGELWFIRPENF